MHLARLNSEAQAKGYVQFLPMMPGHWYEVELTNQLENLFQWTRIKEYGMNIDRRYLEFKTVEQANNEAEVSGSTLRLIKGESSEEESGVVEHEARSEDSGHEEGNQ